jgi:predicted RNase H-like HicB family nuclease
MNYPYRYPLSRFLAGFGVTLTIRIEVLKDSEAGVYVATSPDINGLVIEAESFSQLIDEVTESIQNLISLNSNSIPYHTSADVIYRDHIAIA